MGDKAGAAGSCDKAVPLLALRAQFHTSMHSLWTVYVVAGAAAAGFGSAEGVAWPLALAVTLMFWLFTGGHLALMRQTLRAIEAMRQDLEAAQRRLKKSGTMLPRTLEEGAGNRNPLWKSTAIHLAIDGCVTAGIWSRFIFGAAVG